MKTIKSLVLLSVVIAPLLFSLVWSADKTVEGIAKEYAAPPVPVPAGGAPKEKPATDLDKYGQEWRMKREENKLIECGVISGVALLSLYIVLSFISRARQRETSSPSGEILLASGLILIIFATIFIVVVADVEQQLSASIGVLGAIAGYLFGRRFAETPGPLTPRPSGSPGPGGPQPPPGPGQPPSLQGPGGPAGPARQPGAGGGSPGTVPQVAPSGP